MRSFLLSCGLALVAACSATEAQLHTRASFDLHCPAANIRFMQIDGRTYGVEGCGQRATYVESCQPSAMGQDCTWVLNGDSRAAAEAGSAAAPTASSAPNPADPKACESAQEYRRRAGNADGEVRLQLTKLADSKDADCKAQKPQ
jgi:hypothetical protein